MVVLAVVLGYLAVSSVLAVLVGVVLERFGAHDRVPWKPAGPVRTPAPADPLPDPADHRLG